MDRANAEFAKRAGPPPPLPRIAAEDRLSLRDEITQHLGGKEARRYVESIGLDHTVKVQVEFDNRCNDTPPLCHIFGLSEVDNMEKLKTIVCENFGQEASGCMLVGDTAAIYSVTTEYTPNHGPDKNYRAVSDHREFGKSTFGDDDRLYVNATTKLMAQLSHPARDCLCGDCDGMEDVPIIYVRIKLIVSGSQDDKRPSKRKLRAQSRNTARTKTLAKFAPCFLLQLQDFTLQNEVSEQRQFSPDHRDSAQSNILCKAKVFRRILRRRDEAHARVANVQDQDDKIKALQIKLVQLNQQFKALSGGLVIPDEATSSEDGPPQPKKRCVAKLHKAVGKAISQEKKEETKVKEVHAISQGDVNAAHVLMSITVDEGTAVDSDAAESEEEEKREGGGNFIDPDATESEKEDDDYVDDLIDPDVTQSKEDEQVRENQEDMAALIQPTSIDRKAYTEADGRAIAEALGKRRVTRTSKKL